MANKESHNQITTQKPIYKNPKAVAIPEALRNYLRGKKISLFFTNPV
jgi:hypothetical protein